ncbi:MAG: hypothetical protein JW798_12715 [Prolixibacteraceae bacterium]|nr:hypothetical protein [Prolixibacteraceae bacterium]
MFRLLSNAILFTLLGVILFSCNPESPEAFRLIHLEGEGNYYNLSSSGVGYLLPADSASSTAMMIRPGDVIVYNDYFIYPGVETGFRFSEQEGILYNHGLLYSIRIKDTPGWPLLKMELGSMDLSSLEQLCFAGDLPAESLPLVKKIADVNPCAGLYFDKWNSDMADILNMFTPTWLSISGISLDDFAVLPFSPSTETVILELTDSLITRQLPPVPGMKHLIMADTKGIPAGDDSFLSQNPQLETVVFSDCMITDFGFLSPLKKLNSITIINGGDSLNLDFLKQQKNLTRLGILTDHADDWSLAGTQENVNWLVLYGDIGQGDFNSLVEQMPGIQVMELLQCDLVTDLNALTRLEALKALTVSDTLADRKTPLTLGGLDYISFPVDVLDDSLYMARLKEAHPNAVLVPNEGFCMGAGWLMLLVPAVLFVVLIRRKYFSGSQVKDGCSC